MRRTRFNARESWGRTASDGARSDALTKTQLDAPSRRFDADPCATRVALCQICVTELTCENMPQKWVEVAGVEPASSGMSVGLLRAHPGLEISGRPRSPAAVGDPSLSAVSRRVLRRSSTVSHS